MMEREMMNRQMIWQLMKRDPAWRVTPLATAFFAVFAVFGHGFVGVGLFFFLFSINWIMPGLSVRCTFYEAALPIEGRDLWLARTVSQLALIWIPVAAGALVASRFSPGYSLLLLDAAALLTLVLLSIQRFRIREFSLPRWVWLVVLFAGLMLLMPAAVFLESTGETDLVPHRLLLSLSALASAVLFLSTWLAVPKTFQCSPVRLKESVRGEANHSRFLWSPVVRTILIWELLAIFQLTFLAFVGSFAGYFIPWIVLGGSTNARCFLAPLPVRASALFRIIIAPIAAAIVIGEALRAIFETQSPLSPRAHAAQIAISLIIILACLFVVELFEWRRLSRTPLWIRTTPVLLLAAASLLAWLHWGNRIFDNAAVAFAAALPQNWLLFGCTLFAPVALLYWLTEAAFTEMEYPTVLRTKDPFVWS